MGMRMGSPADRTAQDPRNKLVLGKLPTRPPTSVPLVRERGQSLVELAFVLPVLLLLLVGIIEIGRFAYYGILVANAARAGAQYGAQSLAAAADTTGISNAGTNDAPGITAPNTLTVTSTQSCGCSTTSLGTCGTPTVCAAGRWLVYVQVTATGSFNSLFSYPGLPKTFAVTRVQQMVVAQ
jgi:Flp pilus assembly protein TadG